MFSGRTSRSIGITKGALSPGQHYKIKVQVTAPGYAASSALVVGTVNYVPYAGTCVLDKSSGRVSTLAETKTKYKCVSKFRLLKLRYGRSASICYFILIFICTCILGFEPNFSPFFTVFDYILLMLHNKMFWVGPKA